MQLTKQYHFDAAHYLPHYVGPCHNLHGHRWVLLVTLTGKININTGMIVDFKDIDKLVKPIIDKLDHHLLNDIVGNPTCENLLQYIGDQLLINELANDDGKQLWFWDNITLYESPEACGNITRTEMLCRNAQAIKEAEV